MADVDAPVEVAAGRKTGACSTNKIGTCTDPLGTPEGTDGGDADKNVSWTPMSAPEGIINKKVWKGRKTMATKKAKRERGKPVDVSSCDSGSQDAATKGVGLEDNTPEKTSGNILKHLLEKKRAGEKRPAVGEVCGNPLTAKKGKEEADEKVNPYAAVKINLSAVLWNKPKPVTTSTDAATAAVLQGKCDASKGPEVSCDFDWARKHWPQVEMHNVKQGDVMDMLKTGMALSLKSVSTYLSTMVVMEKEDPKMEESRQKIEALKAEVTSVKAAYIIAEAKSKGDRETAEGIRREIEAALAVAKEKEAYLDQKVLDLQRMVFDLKQQVVAEKAAKDDAEKETKQLRAMNQELVELADKETIEYRNSALYEAQLLAGPIDFSRTPFTLLRQATEEFDVLNPSFTDLKRHRILRAREDAVRVKVYNDLVPRYPGVTSEDLNPAVVAPNDGPANQ